MIDQNDVVMYEQHTGKGQQSLQIIYQPESFHGPIKVFDHLLSLTKPNIILAQCGHEVV